MHGISLDRRLTLLTRAAEGRKKTRTQPAVPPRAVFITYASERPCAPGTGDERTIEIHNIQLTKDGNYVIDAWCRDCAKRERFRLDRITSHRTLRSKYQGPAPKITPYFSAFGPAGAEMLTRPITTKATAPGLLSGACTRVAAADSFRDTFGPAETYPRRRRPVTAGDLVRQTQTTIETKDCFLRTYPRPPRPVTADDLLHEVRTAIEFNEHFTTMVSGMDASSAEVTA